MIFAVTEKGKSEMARYIDADALREPLSVIIENAEAKELYNIAFNYEHCLKMIEDTPTADVAPRAEVANKICCEIEEEIVAALESNYRALKEWDDGRCNDYILEMVNRIQGKIDALRGIEAFVEELKKKYTEVRE
jgi:hypothetical protein